MDNSVDAKGSVSKTLQSGVSNSGDGMTSSDATGSWLAARLNPGKSEAARGHQATDADPSHRAASRRAKVALAVVITVFALISSVIAVKTPAWESNDEPGHVQNIETLVSGHWYVMHVGPTHSVAIAGRKYVVAISSSGTEAHQAPLYYLALAAWQRLTGVPATPPRPGPPDVGYPSRGFFVHHSTADHRFLLWLRLPNVVFGALTIWFTFLACRIITKDPWSPVIAASIIGFLPRFVFLSAFVTNDNLVNLLGAVLTFVALRCFLRPTRWRMVVVGAVVGLLIMTKLSTLPMGLVFVVLAFKERKWLDRLQLIAIGCATSIVVCGWYLIQNTYRYGSPLALGTSERYLSKVMGLGTLYGVQYRVTDPAKYIFVEVPTRFLDVFWYGSGWEELFRWPWTVGLLFWSVLVLALLGLVGRHVSLGVLAILGTLTVTGFLSVWIVAFETATYDPRLALGGMPALACLAALGLERWRLGVRAILPLMGLGGTLFAIQANVLAVHWS